MTEGASSQKLQNFTKFLQNAKIVLRLDFDVEVPVYVGRLDLEENNHIFFKNVAFN